MDDKLYKYRSLQIVYDENGRVIYDGIERCIDIIQNNRLFFPKREKLNDPYEGIAIPIELGVCGESLYRSLGLLHPIIQDRLDEYRILSLSATPLSMQMWAHYANNYDGVCFEFDKSGIIGTASKVEYIDKPFEAICDPEPDELDEAVRKSFFYKSKNWMYEEEYRIVNNSTEDYIKFEREEITGIIVGQVALKREDVRKRLVDLARKESIPVYYVFFTPQEYKLSIVTKKDVMDLGGTELEDVLYL